jgi:hypothetical protein
MQLTVGTSTRQQQAAGPRWSKAEQVLKVEDRSKIILRSDNRIGLAHREGPEDNVAKRHLAASAVTPNPYANLQPLTVGFVEREVDVDGVNTRPFRLKTRRPELSHRKGIDQECMPRGLR